MLKRTSVVAAAIGLPLLLAGPAFASEGSFQADLSGLNGSGASGTAMVTVNGGQIQVEIQSQGLLEGAPHAQHIHFGAEARHECPTMSEDADGNGELNTTEGQPAYGPIVTSLTTEGDTSPDSGLAVDRFPVGNASYSRTIEVSQEVLDAIHSGEAVVVQHGVDHNGSGTYDGDVKSELKDSLPSEATNPATCGVLTVSQSGAPSGGVATGAGGTSGTEQAGLLAAGAAGLLAAGAVAVRRRSRASSTI